MTTTMDQIPGYYLANSPMSDPREHAALLDTLPDDVPGIVRAVQGLMTHIFWSRAYGKELSEARQAEVSLRTVHSKLSRMLELNPAPLDCARPYEQKLVGNCRDFSLLTSAILRSKGIPARSRCGFGTYFLPDHFEDHWVVERWDAGQGRWVMLDAQLDEVQREALQIGFDTLDMPQGAFVTGGAAWTMCRQGQANADDFGIFDMHGWDFILGNLYRDLAAQNRYEILPWDDLPAMQPPVAERTAEALAQVDRIAGLLTGGNADFAAVRALYAGDRAVQVPAEWL